MSEPQIPEWKLKELIREGVKAGFKDALEGLGITDQAETWRGCGRGRRWMPSHPRRLPSPPPTQPPQAPQRPSRSSPTCRSFPMQPAVSWAWAASVPGAGGR